MNFVRKTPREVVSFDGLGLHSGAPVVVRVHPGDAGIWFRCGDEKVEAIPENVSETIRCTRLGGISTIEHLMSAFAALEITDADVELTAPELPALDGSSVQFYDALNAAGLQEIGSSECRDIFSRLFIQDDGERKLAVGKGDGHFKYLFDLGARWPFFQEFETRTEHYRDEIASARTLVLSEELEMAMKAGLGKGLTEESVLIIDPNGYRNEARFPDEPPRHKMLDLIGDLYLAGVPVNQLNVVAERTGHRTNVEMAKMLRDATR